MFLYGYCGMVPCITSLPLPSLFEVPVFSDGGVPNGGVTDGGVPSSSVLSTPS